MPSPAWSAELALAGAGGEVDLWRSIQSHGLVDLPPVRVDDEKRALEVVPLPGTRPRTVRIEDGRKGHARVTVTSRGPGGARRAASSSGTGAHRRRRRQEGPNSSEPKRQDR